MAALVVVARLGGYDNEKDHHRRQRDLKLWPMKELCELMEGLNIIKHPVGDSDELTDEFTHFLSDKTILITRNPYRSERQEEFEAFMDIALMWRYDLPYTELTQVAAFLLGLYEMSQEKCEIETRYDIYDR